MQSHQFAGCTYTAWQGPIFISTKERSAFDEYRLKDLCYYDNYYSWLLLAVK